MLSVPVVKRLLKQGLTDNEIAEQLGYSRYQVIKFRQANNIPSSHKWKSDKKIKEINKLRNKCKNQAELAKKVGLSQNRISEIIKEHGVDYERNVKSKTNNRCIVCGEHFKSVRKAKYCSDDCRKKGKQFCIICNEELNSYSFNGVCSKATCKEEHRQRVKREHRNLRRAWKYNVTGNFTEKEFKEISLNFFGWKCAYTGEPIQEDLSNCHREHVVPLSKGGDNGIWNIVPALDWVNLSKNNSNMEEWYRQQSYFSEERLNKIYEYIDLISELYKTKPNTAQVEERVSLDKDHIKELIEKGCTDVEIAEQLNYSPTGIMTFRKKNNIYSSREFKDMELIKQINKLNGKVKTRKELADRLGITTKVLTRILKNYNIEFIKKKVNFRKFGTWTIVKKINPEEFECKCDCGAMRVFNLNQINRGLTLCRNCNKKLSETKRKRMFLGDYKRAEKIKQKDLKKRGKSYIINSVKNIDELGRDIYVNLCCTKGHMTKNNFNNYDGCKVCN